MSALRSPRSRFGIGEWYGGRLHCLDPAQRSLLAATAQKPGQEGFGAATAPSALDRCPFRAGKPHCSKAGGVCSLQRYERIGEHRSGAPVGEPVITCPHRFEEDQLLLRWLAEIVGFDPDAIEFAREVPFMRNNVTQRPAGKLDWIIAQRRGGALEWVPLEVQAVYFSGKKMETDFQELQHDPAAAPPFPREVRRPDWRSSSAKRLMPQLQVKAPTMRRWGKKIAVAIDKPFFEAIGGQSERPSRDLDDGDIVWLVPEMAERDGRLRLVRGHWEVLTLEQSSQKLLSADTVSRSEFESTMLSRLKPLST